MTQMCGKWLKSVGKRETAYDLEIVGNGSNLWGNGFII